MTAWRVSLAFAGQTARTAGEVRTALHDRWEALDGATHVRYKVGALVVVTVAAYHYSLASLLQTIGADTPLAYLGLVPVLAAGMAVLKARPHRHEPPIHDRELDYILGVPMLIVALVAVLILPGRMGEMYWIERIDLLSLPLFVTGATILLFGTRVAWRQKAPIAFLLLAWPWPYATVLLGTLGGFTSVTLAGLHAVLNVLPVAHSVSGPGNEGLFEVAHHGQYFPVSVVTACSGVDGMVGFFLVGASFLALVRGPWIRKGIWLAVGLLLLWTTNLIRLVGIFAVGMLAGQHLALSVLHPVAGIVMFCLGQAVMLLFLKPLGLNMSDLAVGSQAAGAGDAPRTKPGTKTVFLATAILASVALVLGVDNSALAAYDPVATAAGAPKLGSFLAQPGTPAGWRAVYTSEYTINKPLFGTSSRWFRYIYNDLGGSASSLHSSLPVTADVINAGGISGFRNFGVVACYSFHGYTLRDVAQVDLGYGISGQALSYLGAHSGEDWSLVYWIWPVATQSGTRYERIILYLQNTTGIALSEAGVDAGSVHGLKGALNSANPTQARLLASRAFLVAFAKQVIDQHLKAKDTLVDIQSLHPGTGTELVSAANQSGVQTATPTLADVVAASGPRAQIGPIWPTGGYQPGPRHAPAGMAVAKH